MPVFRRHELERPWVQVLQVHGKEIPVKAECQDESDCDEHDIVLVTPLNGSYDDLDPELETQSHVSITTIPLTVSANLQREGSTSAMDRKRRSRFDENSRKETCDTRNIGACMRCHIQRIRCKPNPDNPEDPFMPCRSCMNVSKSSKKTIHKMPCLRYKFTTMTIYRAGGLNLTERFSHTQVMDVSDHADNVIRTIEMTQGLCRIPIKLEVRRFKPWKTDVCFRRWIDNGVAKRQDLPPFCLADIEKTAIEFKQYIFDNALCGLAEAAKDSADIVKETFAKIVEQCSPPCDATKCDDKKSAEEARKEKEQRDFLQQAVRLWFAIRHGTGSSWICGSEKLGMDEVNSPNYPLSGRVSLPRMIIAQFDSIRHERVYKWLAPKVLKLYESFLTSNNMEAWFTVYLATFLLLHEVACTSQDRRRFAIANSLDTETRYGPISGQDGSLTSFVEQVQHGGVVLLAYWQYYKRCDLMNYDWSNPEKSPLKFLKPDQVQFIKGTVEALQDKCTLPAQCCETRILTFYIIVDSIPKTGSDGAWEHELFWISKMFELVPSKDSMWSPPEAFTTTKPSVGRDARVS
ncbi:hypothetical protein B0T17DRAFT_482682 [Bombardia bombarda]|uniref:Zn(2)-C6 fungal-type domain-containing protein n=1 Tax=Bombardia bombarda TaxID=252184 RepID=A0AA39XNA1_9PEZI|nr:hypothetical protein B0T17DRAFT_482682 [Bombardia bombarda]